MTSPKYPPAYFDTIPDRRASESIKWNLYDPDVLPLWVADMDFRSPLEVIAAIQERAAHGVFGYAHDMPELLEATSGWLAERYRWQVRPEEIVLLPGVVSAFNLVSRLVGKPGDGVLIQPPIYPPFLTAPAYSGRVRQESPLQPGPDGGYAPDLNEFRRAIDERTRMFLFCNPHNPTGRVYRRAELEGMAEVCLSRDVFICSDEIHCDLVYPGQEHVPMASLSPEVARRTVTLMAPSKTFNIAGLGCSFAVVHDPQLRSLMCAERQGPVGHAGLIGQVAALAAYRRGASWLAGLMDYLQANRDFLSAFVRERLPGVRMHPPEATYLAWLDCRDLNLQPGPAKFFLHNARVGLNEGASFGQGGAGFVRLNFGCPRSLLEEALGRMERALNEHIRA